MNSERRQTRRLPVRALVVTALACGAVLALPVAAHAWQVSLNPIKASKGYKLRLSGNKVYLDSTLSHKKKGLASYSSTDFTVTSKQLKANFGPIGSVNLKYKKFGKKKKVALPKRCTGKPGKRRNVVAHGTIKLKGEGNFSRIKVGKKRKLKGKWIVDPIIKKCKPPKSGGSKPDQLSITFSGSTSDPGNPAYWKVVDFNGRRLTAASSKAHFVAHSYEKFGDEYFVIRAAAVNNRPGSAFHYTDPFTTATVTPGASPFNGSATIDEVVFAVPSGDLKVSFPGRKNVSLTGPIFTGRFDRWSVMRSFTSGEPGPFTGMAERVRAYLDD